MVAASASDEPESMSKISTSGAPLVCLAKAARPRARAALRLCVQMAMLMIMTTPIDERTQFLVV